MSYTAISCHIQSFTSIYIIYTWYIDTYHDVIQCHFMAFNMSFNLILYVILRTELSLFRMWFNSFRNTVRLCLPTFQRHAAEAQLLFLDMGTWAKHCVWRSIPWNTMGSVWTVFPSSPHLHPPCSALCWFAEHEGWELINSPLMYKCSN